MARDSREKGKRGEREAAKVLESLGLGPARRGRQYDGLEGRDVVHSLPGVHVEVKRTEALSLYAALAQATEDAREGEVPLLMHRRSRRPWVFVVEEPHLPALARAVVAALDAEGDRVYGWVEIDS